MADWSAQQYLKFADERTRPARDLLAHVPVGNPRRVYDLGCGPGNSTELLVEKYPTAEIIGVDSSPNMIAAARKALPNCAFVEADLATWQPEQGADLLFANAVFQWVQPHEVVLRRLAKSLREDGVLAVQMPDNINEPSHTLMREIAAAGPWATKLEQASQTRTNLPTPQAYYDLLKPVARHIDIWETVYYHPLDGAAAIVEWLKSTGLRPFLSPLDGDEQMAFLDAYQLRIEKAYPASFDGKVLLRFPRLFIIVQR